MSTLPGLDASPFQGYTSVNFTIQYPVDNRVTCSRTEYSDPNQALNQDHLILSSAC